MQCETHLALAPPPDALAARSLLTPPVREGQLLCLWTGIVAALPIGGIQGNKFVGHHRACLKGFSHNLKVFNGMLSVDWDPSLKTSSDICLCSTLYPHHSQSWPLREVRSRLHYHFTASVETGFKWEKQSKALQLCRDKHGLENQAFQTLPFSLKWEQWCLETLHKKWLLLCTAHSGCWVNFKWESIVLQFWLLALDKCYHLSVCLFCPPPHTHTLLKIIQRPFFSSRRVTQWSCLIVRILWQYV